MSKRLSYYQYNLIMTCNQLKFKKFELETIVRRERSLFNEKKLNGTVTEDDRKLAKAMGFYYEKQIREVAEQLSLNEGLLKSTGVIFPPAQLTL